MRAQVLHDFGGVDQLTVDDVPTPDAGPGQVRIRVQAIGINPMEIRIRSGSLRDEIKTSFPAILGSDVAGVIDQIGEGVGLRVGDRVVGLAENGAYAEYAIARENIVAPIPDTLDVEHAVTIPTAAEAAGRAIGLLDPQRDETVVVNGAAGSVGSAAVQLLARAGVNVIGTASEDNHDYVRGLGANPTPYGAGIIDRIRALAPDGVHAVFDVADHGFIDAAIALRGGTERIVTISDFGAVERGITVSYGDASKITSEDFAPVLALAASGGFETEIARTFTFDDIPAAHQLSETGHLRGKIVVTGPEDESAPPDSRRVETMMTATTKLRSAVTGAVLTPSDSGYEQATTPLNTTARQRPGLVVVAESTADVEVAVRHARAAGARVAVQATGHGAAGEIDAATVLVDTHRLATIEVDAERRVARCGAGALWRDITEAAQPHGLAGLAGTSPTVGVAGYTFNGGVGWLTREHGLASARLLAVDYVDAEGAARGSTADDLWAFRGGGGIGLATAVEFELVPVGDVWAGFLLWAPERMPDVVAAWSDALPDLPPEVSTVVAMLKAAPPAPGIPEATQGRPVAYLGLCATDVAAGRALSAALARALPDALVEAVGAVTPSGLAGIHLDPPGAVPALGDGRFLGPVDAGRATAILEAAQIGADGALNVVELRHVALGDGQAEPVDGALTRPPAPFLIHATGAAPDPAARAATEASLRAVRQAAAPVDTGRAAHSFRDGQPDAPDALTQDVAARLTELHGARDPDGVFAPARSHD